MTVAKVPAGVSANNPFDIEDQGIPWFGRTGKRGTLVAFATPVDGIRAGMIDARSKVFHDNLNTINLFIKKFAPPAQNDTLGYIAFMCKKLGMRPTEPLNTLMSTSAGCIKWAL